MTDQQPARRGGKKGAKAAPPPVPARKNVLTPAHFAFSQGEPIPFLEIGSDQNPAAKVKARKLYDFYAHRDRRGLKDFVIGGNNTYAKALRGYQEILLNSLKAGIGPEASAPASAPGEGNAKPKRAKGVSKEQRAANAAALKDPAVVEGLVKGEEPAAAAEPESSEQLADGGESSDFQVDEATGDAPSTIGADSQAEEEAPMVFTTAKKAAASARDTLGAEAIDGVDFHVVGSGKKWSWAEGKAAS